MTERFGFVDEGEQNFTATCQFPVDCCRSRAGANSTPNLIDLDFDAQGISRPHLPLETDIVDARKERKFVAILGR